MISKNVFFTATSHTAFSLGLSQLLHASAILSMHSIAHWKVQLLYEYFIITLTGYGYNICNIQWKTAYVY